MQNSNNRGQIPRIIIISGSTSQRSGLTTVLENNRFNVVSQLSPNDPAITQLNPSNADALLVDLFDSDEYDLDLDALDMLVDQCHLPILFNDGLVELTKPTWGRKMVSKLHDMVANIEVPTVADLAKDTKPAATTGKLSQPVNKTTANQTKTKFEAIKKLSGELLIDANKITQVELDDALAKQKTEKIGQTLLDSGLISDRDIAIALSRQMAIPLVRPIDYPENALLEDTITVRFIKEYQFIPIRERNNSVAIALVDPTDDYIIKAVQLSTEKKVIRCIAVASEFNDAFERLYGGGKSFMEQIVDDLDQGDDAVNDNDVEQLKDMASEAPIIRLVSHVIHQAITDRASDIHVEPFENKLKVRYRIDGVLQDVESPPANSCAAVISRLKIMAKLDIAERRLPQDGRIKLRVEGKEVDLRVSTIPTMHGESVVMRILVTENIIHDFDSLGLLGEPLKVFLHCLHQPHGILLVTGPTGSGKTTTLYTALQKLNTPGRKILTVEDPVEYQLEGINQIQVKPSIGLTFAGALRSIVRQDPDVIMIGEMRDLETSQIAIQSALTGHMVLSTLHTNDAPSSLTRLMDMGVEDYLVTSAVSGILAQRLVRRLCEHCRKPFEPCQELVADLQLQRFQGYQSLYQAEGCEQCSNTGYSGRVGIVQMMLMSEPIKRLVMKHVDAGVLMAEAEKQGMASMIDDGLTKVIAGHTTIEEVIRVTKDPH